MKEGIINAQDRKGQRLSLEGKAAKVKKNSEKKRNESGRLSNTGFYDTSSSCCHGHGSGARICKRCFGKITAPISTARTINKKVGKLNSQKKVNNSINHNTSRPKQNLKPNNKKSSQKILKFHASVNDEQGTSRPNTLQKYTKIKFKQMQQKKLKTKVDTSSQQRIKIQTPMRTLDYNVGQSNIQKRQSICKKKGDDIFLEQNTEQKNCNNNEALIFNQRVINELKEVNEKLKQNLFESYEKHIQLMEAHHKQMKATEHKQKQEVLNLKLELEDYQGKYENCKNQIHEIKKQSEINIKSQMAKAQANHESRVEKIHQQNEKQKQKIIQELLEVREKYEKSIAMCKQSKKNEEQLKEKVEIYREQIAKLNKTISSLQERSKENQNELKKIKKEKDLIKKNSEAVLEFIRRQMISNSFEGIEELDSQQNCRDEENKTKRDKTMPESQHAQKKVLGVKNY